jgi:hypothetical protein
MVIYLICIILSLVFARYAYRMRRAARELERQSYRLGMLLATGGAEQVEEYREAVRVLTARVSRLTAENEDLRLTLECADDFIASCLFEREIDRGDS